MPGVSTMTRDLRASEFVVEHWNLLRKVLPNLERGLNCFVGSITKAFPGIICWSERANIKGGPNKTQTLENSVKE